MKWYIKNMKLIDGIVMVISVLALAMAVFKDFYSLLIAFSCGALLILLAIFSNFAQKRALKKANQIYENECDSSKLMEIAGAIYKSNSKRANFIINYSTALLNTSLEHYKMVKDALYQMKTTNIPITSPYMEACFCLNLCKIYLNEGDCDSAEECYRKAYTSYEKISNEEQVKYIKNELLICLTELYILIGSIDSAKRELESIDNDTKRRKLEAIYLEARIDLLDEKNEIAYEKLSLVTNEASQITLGQKAKKLLNIQE